LQPCVFRLGLLQDGDVGVGVFPEGEEIFVSGERPDAGGIGIRALRGFRLQRVGTSHSQMRQRSCPAVPDDAAVVKNFLKFGGGFLALSSSEIRLAANVCRIEAGKISDKLIVLVTFRRANGNGFTPVPPECCPSLRSRVQQIV
jgi:hypothetical protein